MGYNGPPRQINDNDVSWERPEKYFTMVHSEVNAIQYSRGDTEGSTLYVTAKPCPACMLSIVSAGISRVVWFPKNITDSSSMLANNDKSAQTDDIAKKGKVTLEVFKGNLNWLKDWVNQLD
jgi:deoxycytidylate deaminase